MKSIYLDYAAATPLDKTVAAAMAPYLHDKFMNPSSPYLAAQSVRKDIDAARKTIAGWLGARPAEITFTSGGTEANNLAISGVMKAFSDKKVIHTKIEHESVIEPAHEFSHGTINVDKTGRVTVAELIKSIDDDTVLVSVIMANNEIGTIQPLRELAAAIKDIRAKRQKTGNKLPLYLHTDACQAAGYLDLHVNRLGVDLMSLNAGKIYGPKQVGALYVKTGVILQPLLRGGGQELGLRSGTENPAGIIGFAVALDAVQKNRNEETKRLENLRNVFKQLLSQNVPAVVFNGEAKSRMPNILSVTIPGLDGERMVMELDEAGIQAATGSACAAASDDPSHVLLALGLSPDEASATLRLSMGKSTVITEVERAAKAIAACATKLRA